MTPNSEKNESIEIENSDDNKTESTLDDKFLINQVEYEFYLERTMEKIEGEVCSPYEILISYPLTFNKNNFNNLESELNTYNYSKLFEMGKELHEKNPEYDTFNKDNILYKDLCKGVEINKKDIVLEDRYKYLYPNNISLCESNCTMNNTDFDLERINCNCTYKEIFDFYRKDEDINDILKDPNYVKMNQSNFNTQIMKCFTKIDLKEGMLKNEMFYFSSVVLLVQLSSIIIAGFHGIKTVASLIKELSKKNEVAIKYGENMIMNRNHTKNNNALDSDKLVNNPPKKENEKQDTNDKDDKDALNNNKKNIVVIRKLNKNYIPINKNIRNDISKLSINSQNSDNNLQDYYPPPSNIRLNHKNIKKKNNYVDKIYNKDIINDNNNNNIKTNVNVDVFAKNKAEYIPQEFNNKYFEPGDKGVVRRVRRSEIPFKVNPNTKFLLEKKKDILYELNYLDGPFYDDQNIIEIVEDIGKKENKVLSIIDSVKSSAHNDNSIIIAKNITHHSSQKNKSKDLISKGKTSLKYKKSINVNNLLMTMNYGKNKDDIRNINASFYNLIKREHSYLRVSYDFYISKHHPNCLAIILADICDKIYLLKTLLLLKRFDIFSVHLSLYLLYHILLLSLICLFFTVKTIRKIWEEPDFPDRYFYLIRGLIANVIIWVIYKIFIHFLDNEDGIHSLIKLNNENVMNGELIENIKGNENKDKNNEEEFNEITRERYEGLIRKIKIKTAVFYIIILIITGACSLYLVTFSAFYTGTKRFVIKTYYISILEIMAIKFVAGFCLGYLRVAAESNEIRCLYNIVYFFDKYFS